MSAADVTSEQVEAMFAELHARIDIRHGLPFKVEDESGPPTLIHVDGPELSPEAISQILAIVKRDRGNS